MVVVSDDINKTKRNGIEIEEEIINKQKVWHSKGYKTSLGADDGIGVALILAIAKNAKCFKHGKIDCILTADEEIPQGGAAYINKNWFSKTKYLINLDNSSIEYLMVGCHAAIENKFIKTYNYEPLDKSEKQYKIKVFNLTGGHSCTIDNTQANSIDLIFKLLSSIGKVKIATFNNFGNLKTNAICPKTEVGIVCKKTKSEIEKTINSFLKQHKYSKDKKIQIKISETNSFMKCISLDDTNNLCDFIIGLNYGAKELDDKNWPITNINVGSVIFNDTGCQLKVQVMSMSRTENKREIKKLIRSQKKNARKYKFVFDKSSIDPIWKEKKNSILQKIWKEVADERCRKINIVVSPAWLEPSEFSKINKKLDMISIGPESVLHHNNKETLFIDSIKPLIEEIVLVLNKLKKEG